MTATQYDPALVARAFAIADETMTSAVECQGLPVGRDGRAARRYSLVDEACNPVRSMTDADPSLAEAFAWLCERRIAVLVFIGPLGQCIEFVAREEG